MAKSSTERSKAYQKRMSEKGLKEIRRCYAPKKNHKEIKEYIKSNYVKGES